MLGLAKSQSRLSGGAATDGMRAEAMRSRVSTLRRACVSSRRTGGGGLQMGATALLLGWAADSDADCGSW